MSLPSSRRALRLTERVLRPVSRSVSRSVDPEGHVRRGESLSESITEMLRTALTETRDRSIAAAKTVCLEIAEDEAERSRGVGATAAQQTALTIASRLRKRHVEVES